MKVAVVISTRNEVRTVANVAAAADAGLGALGCGGLIVNADGGSDDGTGQAFLATPTATPKRLLTVDGEPGKGRNLLAAWRFCLEQGVEAVVTLDGDMASVRPWGVESLVRPIATRGAEFVSPLYRRNLYRAVTTRHVSRAFIYAWFGVDVPHPLSGNAALAAPLLRRLAARDWTPAQLGYGVETAVVSTVLADGRKWATAQLDVCIDAPRCGHRNLTILRDVLTATIETARDLTSPPRPRRAHLDGTEDFCRRTGARGRVAGGAHRERSRGLGSLPTGLRALGRRSQRGDRGRDRIRAARRTRLVSCPGPRAPGGTRARPRPPRRALRHGPRPASFAPHPLGVARDRGHDRRGDRRSGGGGGGNDAGGRGGGGGRNRGRRCARGAPPSPAAAEIIVRCRGHVCASRPDDPR